MRLCSYGLPDVLKAFIVACISVLHWPLIEQCCSRYSNVQDYQYIVQLIKEKLNCTLQNTVVTIYNIRFKVQKLYTLPIHTVFSCFGWISEQISIISMYSIN
jgi:hypothetical protein